MALSNRVRPFRTEGSSSTMRTSGEAAVITTDPDTPAA
jgi:hypothetical protein